MTAFEEALIGATVLDTLEQVLDEIRRPQVDPAPLKAEAVTLRAEIARLVNALAAGSDMAEITDGLNDRKRRLAEIEACSSGPRLSRVSTCPSSATGSRLSQPTGASTCVGIRARPGRSCTRFCRKKKKKKKKKQKKKLTISGASRRPRNRAGASSSTG